MNASQLIVRLLENIGVDYIFGVPGGAIEDLNTAIFYSGKINPIVTKHEAGAAFMADGFARVSGKLGVCCSTAGPGATNMLTGIATASGDSVPVLALTGQVATHVFGKGAVQESGIDGIDVISAFANITKYHSILNHENRTGHMVQKAIRTALSGRRGPVHINLPADIMKKNVGVIDVPLPVSEARIFDRKKVNDAAEVLLRAERPAIIAGWGVVLSRGARELFELAELLSIPVVTTPKAKGVFPESNALSLGVLGFAGFPAAREYIIDSRVDVLMAVGTSFNEMMSSGWDEGMLPAKHLIQIDIDEMELSKNYPASIEIFGDARTVLKEITYSVNREMEHGVNALAYRSDIVLTVQNIKNKYICEEEITVDSGLYHPATLVKDIQKSFPPDTIYFAEIGNTMAWAIRHMIIDRPYSFFTALGFGSMGYAVAAPVGAKLAFPDRPMVSLAGDGSFLMNGNEVATAVNYNIPVIWIIFNNAMLGLVYHGRKLFDEPVPEGIPSRFKRIDFVKIAEGLGARGIRIEHPGQVTRELVNEIMESGLPTVIDVWIDQEAVPPIHSRIKTVDKHFV